MSDTSPLTLQQMTSPVRNKMEQVSLIPLQSNTLAPRVVISSVLNEFNTTNFTSVSIFIHLGRVSTSAFTSGVNFRIEGSSSTSGDGYWFPVTIFTSALGANIGSQNLSSTAAAAQKVISISNTTNFVVGDIVYINNVTESNSEFGRITTVTTNVSITLEDNLRFSQPTTSLVTSKSEMYYALIDTSALKRLRCVCDGSGTGQNFDCEVYAVVGA